MSGTHISHFFSRRKFLKIRCVKHRLEIHFSLTADDSSGDDRSKTIRANFSSRRAPKIAVQSERASARARA